jgi:uncharacterized membrane protein YhaH (DUF805 family)
MMKKLANIMFVPHGRISRGEYLGGSLIIYLLMLVLPTITAVLEGGSFFALIAWAFDRFMYLGLDSLDGIFGEIAAYFGLTLAVTIMVWIAGYYSSLAMEVKRWHDQNLSGWLALLTRICTFIPYIGWLILLVLAVILFFVRGTVGNNKYGEDPAPAPQIQYLPPRVAHALDVQNHPSPQPIKDEALEALRLRFVNGEITADEFKQIKEVLEES